MGANGTFRFQKAPRLINTTEDIRCSMRQLKCLTEPVLSKVVWSCSLLSAVGCRAHGFQIWHCRSLSKLSVAFGVGIQIHCVYTTDLQVCNAFTGLLSEAIFSQALSSWTSHQRSVRVANRPATWQLRSRSVFSTCRSSPSCLRRTATHYKSS